MPNRRAWVVGLLATSFLSGCGGYEGPTRYDVSGEVTYDGRPLPAGQIRLIPDTVRGNRGPAGFAVIREGRYDTRADGKGVIGGPHVVLIDGFDGEADPDVELEHGRPLFSSHRTTKEFPTHDATADFSVPVADPQ